MHLNPVLYICTRLGYLSQDHKSFAIVVLVYQDLRVLLHIMVAKTLII